MRSRFNIEPFFVTVVVGVTNGHPHKHTLSICGRQGKPGLINGPRTVKMMSKMSRARKRSARRVGLWEIGIRMQ